MQSNMFEKVLLTMFMIFQLFALFTSNITTDTFILVLIISLCTVFILDKMEGYSDV